MFYPRRIALSANQDCVAKVLEKYMDRVEKSEGCLKSSKFDLAGTIYQRVWLLIELRYDSSGLTIEKISESKFMNPDGIPDQDTFHEKTKDYITDPTILKLLDSINKDIKKLCK